MTYFQKLLYDLIDEHELTQSELAKKLNMAQSQISNYLNGKSKPGYDSIRELSRIFNISADAICNTTFEDWLRC